MRKAMLRAVSIAVLLLAAAAASAQPHVSFVPGEVIESDLFGQLAVARRWWLAPGPDG